VHALTSGAAIAIESGDPDLVAAVCEPFRQMLDDGFGAAS
jgi:hypothetical protein